MPRHPQIESGDAVTYHTTVLGCKVTLDASANRNGISVAEAVLGTLEAFFATSLNERIIPYRPTAKIVAEAANDLTEGLRVIEVNSDGDSFIRVQYPEVNPPFSAESRGKYRNGLMDLIARFIVHTAVVDDVASYFTRIAEEERGFARALLYSETSLAQDNLFGSSPKVLLGDWSPPDGAMRFPLIRKELWYEGLSIVQIPIPDDEERPKLDPNDPGAFFREKADSEKHGDRKIASQIDIPTWNEARWQAVFYLFNPRVAPYPVLCLGFENGGAAENIFRGWRQTIGSHDKENKLRITILRGIQRENPAAYRVYVSTNIGTHESSNSIVVVVGRHQTMGPTTTKNLDDFLESVGKFGKYLLAPAHFVSETEMPNIGFGLAILKYQLVVRNTWEVSSNDIDAGAIVDDDDPVIPPGVKDAPVVALLEKLRRFAGRRAERP